MITCPCCGHAADKLRLSEARDLFTATQLKILESIECRRVATMSEIIDDVWGDDINGGPLDTRVTVSVHLVNIRKRMREAGLPYEIKNVWGVGFKLMQVQA